MRVGEVGGRGTRGRQQEAVNKDVDDWAGSVAEKQRCTMQATGSRARWDSGSFAQQCCRGRACKRCDADCTKARCHWSKPAYTTVCSKCGIKVLLWGAQTRGAECSKATTNDLPPEQLLGSRVRVSGTVVLLAVTVKLNSTFGASLQKSGLCWASTSNVTPKGLHCKSSEAGAWVNQLSCPTVQDWCSTRLDSRQAWLGK